MEDVDAFVGQNRKRAADSIQRLTKEAEELRARLRKVEMALERWKTLAAALESPPASLLPAPLESQPAVVPPTPREPPATDLSPAPVELPPAERAPGVAPPRTVN
jgi:hypothetical protein